MIQLSYGFWKPEDNDTGDVFFPKMADNVQQTNDHNHDGVNSPFISTQAPSAMANFRSPSPSGATVDQNNPYFGESFVFAQGAEQIIRGLLKVYKRFGALLATQGVVIFPYYSPAIAGFIKFELTTTLIKGGAAVSSVTNQNVASLEVELDAPANQLRTIEMPFTDVDGLINGLAIENADSLIFELKRVFPAASETVEDVIVKGDLAEVVL